MSQAEIEDDDEIEMRAEDSFSNSPERSDDDDDADEEAIIELQKKVDSNPYVYDLHVQLITLCKKCGELEKLRAAREKMHKLFPLSPELWLDWITDEKNLANTAEQKTELASLFERALKDYPSVSIWLEYVQFSIGRIGDKWDNAGLETIRQAFEKAITSVGIHVAQGCLIWEAYRELETVYLLHLKNQGAEEEVLKSQEDKIYNIFKRQLSVPLLDMDKTFEELNDLNFESFSTDEAMKKSYERATGKLEQLKPYEESLYISEAPHYEEYKRYIEFEKKQGDPARVQSLFERALIENCLKEDLWMDYTKYADKVLKNSVVSIPIHERAVRNCPWSVQLWVNYGRALERYNEPHQKIIDMFESSLVMGFTKAEDFKELWLGYLNYLKRKIDKERSEGVESGLKNITDVFDRAVTQMKCYFWGSESEYILMKFWIFFTTKYLKDNDGARKIWKELIDHGHKEEARVWLDYANYERLYGDAPHYRKVLLSALSSVNDWQETFVDLLITFEREEGTLESLENSLAKCETQMQLINEKRLKELERATNSAESRDRRKNTKRPKSGRGQPAGQDTISVPVQMDSEGFKIPPPPEKRVHTTETKQDNHPNKESGKRKRPLEEENKDAKKSKTESESHGMTVKHDPSKDDRTIFLSNLAFQTSEDNIKEFCSQIGEVEEVRLVKDFKGRSKGYCYVVYKSQDDAKAAIAKDRESIDGRPVYVSPCEDRKSNPPIQHSKLKFATGLEKNKLFIKGLPSSTTKEDLENMFKEFGVLKNVRLVTYRNGHAKGIAYVEFEEEGSASNAVVKMDGSQFRENVISVALSNPPPRKPKNEFTTASVSHSLGSGQGARKAPRGRGRTQLTLVPRSVIRPQQTNKDSPANGSMQNGQSSQSTDSNEATKPLSNSDFAKMLQK